LSQSSEVKITVKKYHKHQVLSKAASSNLLGSRNHAKAFIKRAEKEGPEGSGRKTLKIETQSIKI
jgi:hypothetical protein